MELWANIAAERARLSSRTWIIGGDFNLVTNRTDRRGRSVRFSNIEAQDFRFFYERDEDCRVTVSWQEIFLVST